MFVLGGRRGIAKFCEIYELFSIVIDSYCIYIIYIYMFPYIYIIYILYIYIYVSVYLGAPQNLEEQPVRS